MANVELKQPIIQEIAGQVEGAQSVVVIDYRGINVADDTELRRAFREEGIVYKVYKNTMMKRAFEGTDFEKLDPVLEGPSAIAISKDDATAPARLIAKYAKKMDSLEIKAGIVEGDFYDAAAMQKIAAIPSREELLGKLLGSLQSPIANFARVLDQLAEKGGYEAIAPEEEEPAAEEAPAEEPAAEEPAAEEPAAEEPAAEEPAAEEPAAEEPAAEEPAAEEAPAEEPAAEEPAAEEPAAEEPAAEEPAAEEPAAEEPAAEEPAAEEPAAEEPAAEEPAAEEPAAEEPAAEESAEEPTEEKSDSEE